MKKVAVIIAMPIELEKIGAGVFNTIVESEELSPFKLHIGTYNNGLRSVPIIVSGVGKIKAAAATQFAIDRLRIRGERIDHIINIGVCGASMKAAKREDILEIKEVINNDYDTSAIDGDSFKPQVITIEQDVLSYPLFTQDHFVTDTEKDGYFDMEGFAVAQVAKLNNIDCTLIKSVTDVIKGGKQKEEYNYNMNNACEKAGVKLIEVLRKLDTIN